MSARPEKKEANAQDKGRPAENQSGNRGQVVPPDLPGDPEPESGGPPAQAQSETRDCKRK